MEKIGKIEPELNDLVETGLFPLGGLPALRFLGSSG
jgi:hypothetical protein